MANMVFSEDCYPHGDTNWDGTLDILDIVVTVNSVLGSSFNECSDINYDLEVIGHAFSLDGIHWNRNSNNPDSSRKSN